MESKLLFSEFFFFFFSYPCFNFAALFPQYSEEATQKSLSVGTSGLLYIIILFIQRVVEFTLFQ